MHWFLIALGAPLLWSLANHVDKYLLSKHFGEKEGAGGLVIFFGTTALLAMPIIALLDHSIFEVNFSTAALLILGGGLINICVFFYLYILQKKDASYIVPFWQLAPVFAYILGIVFLAEYLSIDKIFGSLIAICGAFLLSLDLEGNKFKMDAETIIFMSLSSLCIAAANVLFKGAAIDLPFWTSIFWNQMGMFLFALAFLVVPKYRKEFFGVFTRQSHAKKIVIINLVQQIGEAVGVFISNYALLLAPVALVTLVEYTAQPMFVLVEGLLLTLLFPKLIRENIAKRHLTQKLLSVTIMCIGLYFIMI